MWNADTYSGSFSIFSAINLTRSVTSSYVSPSIAVNGFRFLNLVLFKSGI